MDSEEEQISKNLRAIQNYLAERTTDPKKALANFEKFASQNDARAYKLILNAIDVKTEYKTVVKDLVRSGWKSRTFDMIDLSIFLTSATNRRSSKSVWRACLPPCGRPCLRSSAKPPSLSFIDLRSGSSWRESRLAPAAKTGRNK